MNGDSRKDDNSRLIVPQKIKFLYPNFPLMLPTTGFAKSCTKALTANKMPTLPFSASTLNSFVAAFKSDEWSFVRFLIVLPATGCFSMLLGM